ncbi:MAG: hypothetical protein ACLPKI_21805 [Streptosporangiaceae bacterium]
MWPDALRSGRDLVRVPGPALWAKLAAATLCLLAAGAAVIAAVSGSALRSQLTRQEGEQLRAYTNQLTSHRFQVLGTSRFAPGAASTAALAGAPGGVVTAVPGTGAFSIELRGADGQMVLSAGPGTRPGLPLPESFAPVPARTGVLLTVRGADGTYLVIAEPVRFTARRLVFGYGADDFSVTSGTRHGTAGLLVAGLHLAGIGRAVARLTLLGVAVSAGIILLATGSVAAAVQFRLRPLARAARTADAVAAGDLSRRVPGPPGGALAGSLNGLLSQHEAREAAAAVAEAAAAAATDRMGRDVVAVARELRRPVSLLHGLAGSWPQHTRRGPDDTDRALREIAEQAARAEAVLTELDGHSPPG